MQGTSFWSKPYKTALSLFIASSAIFGAKLLFHREFSPLDIDYGATSAKIALFLQAVIAIPFFFGLVGFLALALACGVESIPALEGRKNRLWLILAGLASLFSLTPLVGMTAESTPVLVLIVTPLLATLLIALFSLRLSYDRSADIIGVAVAAFFTYKVATLLASSGVSAAFPVTWEFLHDRPVAIVAFVLGLLASFTLLFLVTRFSIKPPDLDRITATLAGLLLSGVSIWLFFVLTTMLERLFAFSALIGFRSGVEVLALFMFTAVVRYGVEKQGLNKQAALISTGLACAVAIGVLLWPVTAKNSTYNSGTLLEKSARNVIADLFDSDGDNASTILGEDDCDDSNFGVRPGRSDIPGNGVDENCLAGDLETPDRAKPVWRYEGVSEPRKIIVVSVDTLRSDMVFSDKPVMQNLAAFANKHAGFSNAYALGAATAISMLNLFHPESVNPRAAMRNRNLLSYLDEAGYQSNCFIPSLRQLSPMITETIYKRCNRIEFFYGDDVAHIPPGEKVLKRVSTFLKTAPDKTFAWILLDDIHDYYIHRDGEGYHSRFLFDGVAHLLTIKGLSDYLYAKYIDRARYLDTTLDRYLLIPLDNDPSLKNALFILMSDHGEEFYEHGGVFHGGTVFEEALKVPLLLKDGNGGGVFDHPVHMGDATRTIMETIGFVREPGPSINLRTPYDKNRPLVHFMGNTGDFVIRLGGYKAIVNYFTNATLLFDLAEDPDELTDISSTQPEITAKIKRILDKEARVIIKK